MESESQLHFDFGTAVYSEYDGDDFLGISIDHCGDAEKTGAPPAAVCMPFGLFGRPLDPVKDSNGQVSEGCSVLWWRHGDTISAMPITDPRVQKILPTLQKGEVCVANAFGQFIRLSKNGEITLFTTDDGTPNGKSVYFQVAKDGFRWVAPWGTIKFDATGYHLLTGSGARIDLGGIGGIPLAGSYASVSATSLQLEGGIVSAGATGPLGHQSVALAKPVQAILGQLASLTSQLAGIVAQIVGTTGTGAPAAALVAPLGAINGQIAAIQGSLASG